MKYLKYDLIFIGCCTALLLLAIQQNWLIEYQGFILLPILCAYFAGKWVANRKIKRN